SGWMGAQSRTRGRWRMTCEHGSIDFAVLLTPAVPPRIQATSWTEVLPPDERLQAMAQRLTAALGHPDDPASASLFDATADIAKERRTLTRLSFEHGTCDVDRVLSSDGRTRAT